MKRSFLTLALLATVAIGGAFATQGVPVNQSTQDNYIYYLENNCDTPIECNDEFEGPQCSVEFSNIVVYNSPSCISGHEASNVLGRLPL